MIKGMAKPDTNSGTANKKPETEDVAQDVADRVHSAAIHLLRALSRKDRTMGVTGARLSALSVLYFAGPMTMSKLAHAEEVKLPTMSRLVKDMVLEQLVTRAASETDGRAQVIEMTPKGKAVFERARVNRLMALTTALENLTVESQKTLLSAAVLLENAAQAIRER